MSELKDRIQQVRQAFNISQRQLAKRIGVTSQLISMIENGKTQLSHLTAKAIEAEFGVNHEWLMTGQGEMMTRKPNASRMPVISNRLMAAMSYYPNIAKAVNSIVERMTIADWEALNDFLSRDMKEQSKGDAQVSFPIRDEE